MSGYLPLGELTAAERSVANAGLPIFQAHGTADPVIPIARAIQSRDALLALGYPVEWHAYPMPHSVCPPEIADMNRWLLKVLA
jgi:phospholipase/carboxylesterase